LCECKKSRSFALSKNEKKLFMKKYLFIAASAIALSTSSCKKDDPVATDPIHVGLWKGKYSNGSTTYPTSGYAMLLRTNGTLRAYDGVDTATAVKAEGTYTISGTTINTTYTYLSGGSTYSTTAALDTKTTFIEGTWGSGTNTTNGGRYFLVKQ
jgi:hypothetical protein